MTAQISFLANQSARYIDHKPKPYNNFFLMTFPRTSVHCKLVPVQLREYENGLFNALVFIFRVTKHIVI